MNNLIIKTFTAQAVIGLHKGYSKELIRLIMVQLYQWSITIKIKM
jgi:hypothetical protein